MKIKFLTTSIIERMHAGQIEELGGIFGMRDER